eukprot:Blabericola_migrator_1__462@NODE_1110_length_5407_cov_298_153558_g476_i3_p1_GENE_NODE_1110_length_5407_cov_298_153558_g476_i3NODE_1110_length_5407_cov_298_153558_g476_i3_p1_ORF_typecomplete_len816_score94_22P53_TAD/PF08563_11/2_4P53_TAD/PF08563_11/82_NODE_1110_length_5407_cov_298_153558_g476_i327185165
MGKSVVSTYHQKERRFQKSLLIPVLIQPQGLVWWDDSGQTCDLASTSEASTRLDSITGAKSKTPLEAELLPGLMSQSLFSRAKDAFKLRDDERASQISSVPPSQPGSQSALQIQERPVPDISSHSRQSRRHLNAEATPWYPSTIRGSDAAVVVKSHEGYGSQETSLPLQGSLEVEDSRVSLKQPIEGTVPPRLNYLNEPHSFEGTEHIWERTPGKPCPDKTLLTVDQPLLEHAKKNQEYTRLLRHWSQLFDREDIPQADNLDPREPALVLKGERCLTNLARGAALTSQWYDVMRHSTPAWDVVADSTDMLKSLLRDVVREVKASKGYVSDGAESEERLLHLIYTAIPSLRGRRTRPRSSPLEAFSRLLTDSELLTSDPSLWGFQAAQLVNQILGWRFYDPNGNVSIDGGLFPEVPSFKIQIEKLESIPERVIRLLAFQRAHNLAFLGRGQDKMLSDLMPHLKEMMELIVTNPRIVGRFSVRLLLAELCLPPIHRKQMAGFAIHLLRMVSQETFSELLMDWLHMLKSVFYDLWGLLNEDVRFILFRTGNTDEQRSLTALWDLFNPSMYAVPLSRRTVEEALLRTNSGGVPFSDMETRIDARLYKALPAAAMVKCSKQSLTDLHRECASLTRHILTYREGEMLDFAKQRQLLKLHTAVIRLRLLSICYEDLGFIASGNAPDCEERELFLDCFTTAWKEAGSITLHNTDPTQLNPDVLISNLRREGSVEGRIPQLISQMLLIKALSQLPLQDSGALHAERSRVCNAEWLRGAEEVQARFARHLCSLLFRPAAVRKHPSVVQRPPGTSLLFDKELISLA